MRIRKFAAAVALGAAAIALSACATSLTTRVTRYQAMPAPQGQTFMVVPGEGMAASGGLEKRNRSGPHSARGRSLDRQRRRRG